MVMNGALELADPFAEAANLESQFYNQGYQEGLAHGRLHGTFEGRALGQEKSFEIWEEVGYYEGWAEMWIELFSQDAQGKEAKGVAHAKTLLELISSFPSQNPSSTSVPAAADTLPLEQASDGVDISSLLALIRSRYRLLCTALGVRPRLLSAQPLGDNVGNGPVEGIDGPAKGVDAKQLLY